MVGSPIDSVGGAMRITHLAFNQPVITHHTAYLRLAGTATLRCERYRALVAEQVLREEIDEIRTYTTPMAARSSDSRSRRFEALTNRVVTVKARGRPKLEPAAGK
jgi:hypothetical protein